MTRVRFVLLVLLVPTLTVFSQSVGVPSAFVDTAPMGARIAVDGALVPERTPALLRGLTPGNHQISVWINGYVQADCTITVAEGTAPEVSFDLVPASITLAFPEDDKVVFGPATQEATGRQFRYPAGTYQIGPQNGVTQIMPVYPEENLAIASGWSLVILGGAALASTAADAFQISQDWATRPTLLTTTLWLSTLFDLTWNAALFSLKAKFQKEAAAQESPTPTGIERPQDLFAKGEDALRSGRLTQAEGAFTQVIREYPQSRLVPGAWFRLARIHTVGGRRDMALAEYRLVAETYPQAETYDRARKALADLYEASGDREAALSNLEAMVLTDGFFDPADIQGQRQRLQPTQESAHAP